MSKVRLVFVCQQCGRESPKWLGRCPGCQEWNSLTEKTVSVKVASAAVLANPPQELSQITVQPEDRRLLSMGELNRMLGGGLVPGSLVLIGGDPGIGKSTLLLQLCAGLALSGGNVVYASGEETPRQIRLRAERLGVKGDGLYLLAENNIAAILGQLEELKTSLLVVDSIQSVFLPELETTPGSITQVRECTQRLMHWAKLAQVPVFITGHVTKDGAIAGPRVLEHIVDCVLYLEGESFSTYRLLRSVKNRFGSTNEVGIFEMKEEGLVEVANPSQVFLSQRLERAVGSVVVPTMEGSRPLLIEIQALTNSTSFGQPRRIANGIDFGRLLMISAVLSRRLGLRLGSQDIIVSAAGGIRVGEPAADLAIALAICSSFRDLAVDPGMVVVAEVGLGGELRSLPQLERRLAEAARLGFKRALVPGTAARKAKNLEVVPVSTLREATKMGLVGSKIRE